MILKILNWIKIHTHRLYGLCKARNDNMFRGINRDPLETVRHAEAECYAWFKVNSKLEEIPTVKQSPE